MATVYSAGDFRNGTTFEMDGNVFKVVEFQHVKPGKGAAFVRTKLKNVITGAVLEKTFNPSEKFPGAEIEKRDMQYLYNDGGLYYFMDNNTYEQIPLNAEQIGDGLKFLKENMNVKILSYKGNVFSVEPPMFVELEVTYTEPGFAGNTATKNHSINFLVILLGFLTSNKIPKIISITPEIHTIPFLKGKKLGTIASKPSDLIKCIRPAKLNARPKIRLTAFII